MIATCVLALIVAGMMLYYDIGLKAEEPDEESLYEEVKALGAVVLRCILMLIALASMAIVIADIRMHPTAAYSGIYILLGWNNCAIAWGYGTIRRYTAYRVLANYEDEQWANQGDMTA